MKIHKIKSTILTLGDLAIFYLSLIVTLLFRYDFAEFKDWWGLHLFPFSALFALWIIIFVIFGLYDAVSFSARQKIRDRIINAMLSATAISIAIFYIWPQAVITPKTNLLIVVTFSTLLLMLWRKIYEIAIASSYKTRLIFFGWSKETQELSNILGNNPHLGYEPVAVILPAASETILDINLPVFILDHNLPALLHEKGINLVVAYLDIQTNMDFTKMLYEVLPLGITYFNFPQFYEWITGKIPVSIISEIWFLENLAENEKRIFEIGKRTFDIVAGAILCFLAVLILPLAAMAIKTGSSGPIFFRQKRVGKNGEIFELIKFRSKVHDGQDANSGWNKDGDESRTTAVGRILRKTYLDELPQAFNIIKGEMSLIGPRPERPEFVEGLKKEIPHYMMRLLARPGITGWAQIKMQYDASAKDAWEKLQYDLYYIKNRSTALDMSIALKTLFAMISRPGK